MTQALFGLESDTRADFSASLDSNDREDHAFSCFYQRFQPRLVRYASRVWGVRDAEEIAQETLVRAYEAIDLSRDERSLWAWLVVVGRNVAADLARARRMCDVGGDSHPKQTTVDPRCVEQSVLDSECLSTLGIALSALPPSQSRAWWLSVAEGMTPAGIAESLACSPEAVRQALFKGRKRLAAAMAEFCERASAFVAPALVLLRRMSHRAPRQLAPAAAGGAFSAAILSSAAFTITITIGAGTAAPAVSAHAMSLAVKEGRESTAPGRTEARFVSTADGRRVSTGSSTPALTQPPVVAHAHVTKKPLAPGKQAEAEIIVSTPKGNVVVQDQLFRSEGDGIVCGRVDLIRCTG